MQIVLLLIHVVIALGICGLVLLQHGKGADMGAAFGSGSSGSLFGASGSANFLSRSTGVLAAAFFITSLALTWFSMQTPKATSVMDVPQTAPAPVVPPEGGVAPVPEPAAPAGSKTGDIPQQ